MKTLKANHKKAIDDKQNQYNLLSEQQRITEKNYNTKIDELKEDSSTKSKNEIVILCYKHLYKSYQLVKTSKDKKFNKEKVKDLKEQEEYILLSNFYYNYATILFEYVNQNQKIDIKTKNYLLQMMKRGFKKIESKL